MQLLIILALLLYGGKNNSQNLLEEVRPVLETFGGDDIKEALKSAEEISGMLSAVRGLADFSNLTNTENAGYAESNSPVRESAVAFPLAPISAIADKDITYSLSKYISAG